MGKPKKKIIKINDDERGILQKKNRNKKNCKKFKIQYLFKYTLSNI